MLEGRFVWQSDMRLLLIHGMGRTPLSLVLLGVPSVHTLIMNSPRVTRIICELLTDSQK
jgi:hypothetical protein